MARHAGGDRPRRGRAAGRARPARTGSSWTSRDGSRSPAATSPRRSGSPESTASSRSSPATRRSREVMRERQRELAELGDAVIEGRDIGTVVCPNADVKVYLVADRRVREERRQAERPDIGADALATDLRAARRQRRARMQPAEDATRDRHERPRRRRRRRPDRGARARAAYPHELSHEQRRRRLGGRAVDDRAAHEALRASQELRSRARPARGRSRPRLQPLLVDRPARLRVDLSADDPLPREERDPQPLRARAPDPRVRSPLRAPGRVRPRSDSSDA